MEFLLYIKRGDVLKKSNITVRILNLKLINFKNVGYGEVELGRIDDIDNDCGNVIGIYGQNGSGKTSIIGAMNLIRDLLIGCPVGDEIKDQIMYGKNFMQVETDFYIKKDEELSYEISYKIKIAKKENNIYIEDESISYKKKTENVKDRNKTLIISRYDEDKIKPEYRNQEIIKIFKDKTDFIVEKKMASKLNQSFIFSESLLNNIQKKKDKDLSEYEILNILADYAKNNFFIIDNKRLALSDANVILPISFRNYSNNNMDSLGILPIGLNDTTKLPKDIIKEIKENLKASNKVLSEIIPGLNVSLKELGMKLSDKGEELIEVELVSINNGVEIPIRYESDGIKKIIAVIHVLIAMYSHSSMTVFIDELDAGIFEYLLGEILYIIEERGKGQLIFTSHNLRPLEVLDRNNLVFTTTNPNNRYIKLKNTKANRNLRDMYYRDIQLGGQDEIIYNLTNSAKINRAFRKASEINE